MTHASHSHPEPEERARMCGARDELHPALIGPTLETGIIGQGLVKACFAFADLKRARDADDVDAFREAALRLEAALNAPNIAALARHVARQADRAVSERIRKGN